MTSEESPRDAMLRRIQDSLQKATSHAQSLRLNNRRLIWLSLIASGLATLLAGATAIAGPLAGEGPPAWRLTCGGVAILTGFSGLLTGAHQRLNLSEKLAAALACVGKLRALELAISVTGRDVAEVAREYEDVVATHQEFVF